MLHLFLLFQRWYENLAINADLRNQRCDYIHWFDQEAPGDELEAVSQNIFGITGYGGPFVHHNTSVEVQ